MDTETHSDNGGINIGSRNLDAGTVGIHHGDIIVASAAKYCAIIALAADFVGIRAAAQFGPISHAGHEVAPIRLRTGVICPVNMHTYADQNKT